MKKIEKICQGDKISRMKENNYEDSPERKLTFKIIKEVYKLYYAPWWPSMQFLHLHIQSIVSIDSWNYHSLKPKWKNLKPTASMLQ